MVSGSRKTEVAPGRYSVALQPGVLWYGTIPGGLFRSGDRGDSWQFVDGFWDLPSRAKWFGGGYDDAGIHSISVDPRGAGHVLVGISCGGAWRTEDGGEPIDTSGAMPDGAKIEGFSGLQQLLTSRRDDFATTIAEKLMIYALGRGL